MHPLTLTLVSLTALATFAPAQDQPQGPAPEQQKFHRLIGTWEGAGKWRMSPDQPEADWTATVTSRSVLDGFFVQEDSVIDLGDSVPAKLRFRTYHGWSPEKKKWISWELSNLGTLQEVEGHWEGDKLITATIKKVEGQVTVERWVTDFGKDSYTIRGLQTVGSGEAFVHVHGSFKRVKAVDAAAGDGAAAPMAPIAPEIDKIKKMAGQYRFEGWMVPAPGAPKMDIKASETVEPILGGTILAFSLTGDPIPEMGVYKGWGAIAWSPEDRCYKQLWISNLGEAMIETSRFVGDKIVAMMSATQMGAPVVSRSVLTMGGDGSLAQIDVHSITGDTAPAHVFHGKYTRK